MRVVALTGTVAAGKSTVAALFREWGAVVVDADALVHALQQPGEPVMEHIAAAFGEGILHADGTLDRAALRRRVFANDAERRTLEAIMHPAVDRRRREALAAAARNGARIAVVDIPLLFEAADASEYDGVIVVDAPVAVRRRRLMTDRGLDAEEADQLLASQLSPAEKRAGANWIIDNDGDRNVLVQQARAVWDALQS